MQARVTRNIQDMYRVETLIPLAIAVLYAWLAKDGATVQAKAWLYWIAPLLVVFGAFRQEARYAYIKTAELYLRKLEIHVYGAQLEPSDPEGWERFWEGNGVGWHRLLRRMIWSCLFVPTFLIALVGGLG